MPSVRLLTAAAALPLVLTAGPGLAEEAPAAPLGEIIVTGERLPRSLRETAASVAVITDAELAAQQPDRVEQVLALVPNVQLGAGDEGPSIRGQNTTGVLLGADAFLGGTRPRTTIRIDGRDVGYNEFIYGLASVWDVERIEVFRTPQTTTQGRNSIAGAIFINTNDPAYTPELRARAIVGSFETYQLSAAASAPVLADQLALRVAADRRESRSWSDTRDLIPDADVRDDDFGLARLKVLAEPTALPGARLEVTYQHIESNAPQGETVRTPLRERRNPVGGGGYWKTNVDSVTGVLGVELAPGIGLSLTSSYGDSRIDRLSPPGEGVARVDAQDFSVEAILAGTLAAGLDALLGAYRLDTEQDERIDLSAYLGIGDFRDEQNSLGLFGEATLRPLPRLSVTLGARYQRDEQDREGFLGTEAFGFAVDYRETFDAFLPKASIAYDLSSALTVGLLAQRAFNPGGTTISFETGEQDVFGAETLWNLEAFARAALLGGRLRLQSNLFFTDFNDAQRPLTTLVTRPDGSEALNSEIANAPEARSYGLELEASLAATDRLSLSAGIGLLETEIREALDPADPIVGNDFERAPGFSAAAAVSWTPLDGLRLDGQLRHNSAYFSDDANTPALRIDGTTVLDAKAAFTRGPLTAFAYVRNAFDEFYLTQLYAPDFGTAGDPREYGVGLEARF